MKVIHRAFRYRLAPTLEQETTLGQWAGVVRFVYNLALEQRRDFWRQHLAAEGRHISGAMSIGSGRFHPAACTKPCVIWIKLSLGFSLAVPGFRHIGGAATITVSGSRPSKWPFA